MKQTAVSGAAQSGNPTARPAWRDSGRSKTGNVEPSTNSKRHGRQDDRCRHKGQPISPVPDPSTPLPRQSGDLARNWQKVSRLQNPAHLPEATLAAAPPVVQPHCSCCPKPKAGRITGSKVNPHPAIEKGPARAEVAETVAKVNEGTPPQKKRPWMELARETRKPKLAAEISQGPPATSLLDGHVSLPDVPLLPIRGAKELSRSPLPSRHPHHQDPPPLQGGIASRSKDGPVTATSAAVRHRWSPFSSSGRRRGHSQASPWVHASDGNDLGWRAWLREQAADHRGAGASPAAPRLPRQPPPPRPSCTETTEPSRLLGRSRSSSRTRWQSKKMSKPDLTGR